TGNIGFPDNGLMANSAQPASVTGSSAMTDLSTLNVSEFEVLVVANGSAVRLALPPTPQPIFYSPNAKTSQSASPKKWVGRIAKLNPSIDPNRPNIAKNGMAGSVWVVGMALAEQSGSIAPDFPIENASDANLKGRNYLRIPLADAEQVIPIRFSEYDRPLLVIPTKQAGRGVGHMRKFMQFSLLPSQQGLLIQLESDGINVGINQGAVIIGGEVPVLLSRQLPPVKSGFDFNRWQNLGEKYDEVRQRLQHVAAQSDDAERDAARFDLAQFFLTYQHAADSIGWLDLLQAKTEDDAESPLPIAQQAPSLIALRGAALMLNGNAKQALRNLGDPRLDGVPQIGLWRGGALAATEQWAAADAAFRAGGNVPPTSWPLYVRSELILRAADAAWHLGNKERVKTLLLDYPSGQSNGNYANRVNYLRAQLRLATDDLFDEKIAIGLLEDMIDRGDAWARAHGTWLRLQIDLKHDVIPLDEATARLEHLRYAWPGGELEYEILKQLGDLYFKMGKPREGLKSMREAATWFPNRPDHPSLRAHLIDRFVELYTDPDLSSVPTLAALAVYDENRDLTPRDARGDAMIQQLAQRLVAIDLLDRAAELLDYQIRVRLSGVEKSRVGANLAEIQIMDNKPELALTALNNSENSENPKPLTIYRNRLRAKALFKTNRSNEALQLLPIPEKEKAIDKESELLRAEIFVATQQWRLAAGSFVRLMGMFDRRDSKAFDENRQNYVVNLAAALVMAGDNVSLQRLNLDFAPFFPDGLQKQAFMMLTSGNNNRNGADLTALMAKFSDLQQFRASMLAFTNGSNAAKPSNIGPTNDKSSALDAKTANTNLAKKP
ncbi:MAG: tetratricopeptide repeat protein, partial [Alphaproteobacteria bacterium]|nr:tetratricopeptide repeat protein [Alphaproteobacteria bacterium]